MYGTTLTQSQNLPVQLQSFLNILVLFILIRFQCKKTYFKTFFSFDCCACLFGLFSRSQIGVDAKQKEIFTLDISYWDRKTNRQSSLRFTSVIGTDKQTKFFTFYISYWDRQTDKFLYVSHQLLEHSNRRKREKYILCDGFCDIRITHFLQV
jgi:hypothetical protein